MSKPQIIHQCGEYVIDAPDGYRWEGLDCHQIVIDYMGMDVTKKQGLLWAKEELELNDLEPCPPDCECTEAS